MSYKKSEARANLAILLLAVCAILLAVNGLLMWVYLSGASQRFARALEAIENSNTRLDVVRGELDSNLKAIQEELHTLNQKASDSADLTPPSRDDAPAEPE
jgi:hypothetical protein